MYICEACGTDISIHALREEGDGDKIMLDKLNHLFLSTPSARRATRYDDRGQPYLEFLSTPSARRATTFPAAGKAAACYFYPRPPRGGRLSTSMSFAAAFFRFLSTPSARRATPEPLLDYPVKIFLSTPSARRATAKFVCSECAWTDFYPRPPRGGRQQKQRQNLYFLINYTTFCTNLEEL